MASALILSGIILLYYCVKESRKSKPNWPKAINATIFWPLNLVVDLFSKNPTEK